ncbi:hypothetical protein AB0L67_33560 [Streptomyces flaveolus]|uniref:hypothetical protein n=2 Tax=Streptomyces flaveolus TaxID=67297 RepID=UPI0034399BDE
MHDLVGDHEFVMTVEVDGRPKVRILVGTNATKKAAPGRCLSALGFSTFAAGTGSASLSSTAQASSG